MCWPPNYGVLQDRLIRLQEDAVLLWKHLVGNKLLKDTQMVLFLNKLDILRGWKTTPTFLLIPLIHHHAAAKLKSGIRFADYVVSYGDRQNDVTTITLCKCA